MSKVDQGYQPRAKQRKSKTVTYSGPLPPPDKKAKPKSAGTVTFHDPNPYSGRKRG